MNLSTVIAPCFNEVHKAIKANKYTEYMLKGGRGSTKSSFVSLEIIYGMMKHPDANAVVLKRIGGTIRESVFEQLLWAIEILEVSDYWEASVSPLGITYIPTGQRIIFRGVDKPKKVKASKLSHGHFKYIWYEELDEFNSMADIRIVNQTFIRGGDDFCVFYTYNPPISVKSWVNTESLAIKKNRLVHHSSYIDVPKQWLGRTFIIEAEHLMKVNEKAYNHEYLGEVTGTGGEIFTNLRTKRLSDVLISTFDKIRQGLDWGYAVDPFAYVKCHYDSTRRRLYIFDEIYKVGLSNRLAAQEVRKKNPLNELVICDSEEPKSVDDFQECGIRAWSAKKGPGSIKRGIKWLQDLEAIIIDPVRCPNTSREFMNYELEKDGLGGFKANYPDKDNHTIDATRYSLESDINGKSVSFD